MQRKHQEQAFENQHQDCSSTPWLLTLRHLGPLSLWKDRSVPGKLTCLCHISSQLLGSLCLPDSLGRSGNNTGDAPQGKLQEETVSCHLSHTSTWFSEIQRKELPAHPHPVKRKKQQLNTHQKPHFTAEKGKNSQSLTSLILVRFCLWYRQQEIKRNLQHPHLWLIAADVSPRS